MRHADTQMVDLVITMWFKNILITGVWNTNWLIMFIFYEQLNHSNMNSDMGKKRGTELLRSSKPIFLDTEKLYEDREAHTRHYASLLLGRK